MGATVFLNTSDKASVKEAFIDLRNHALHTYGHHGYTGTIANKDCYIMCSDKTFSSYEEAKNFADSLIEKCDSRIDDKWGPAGCIKFMKNNNVNYLFFGWASS